MPLGKNVIGVHAGSINACLDAFVAAGGRSCDLLSRADLTGDDLLPNNRLPLEKLVIVQKSLVQLMNRPTLVLDAGASLRPGVFGSFQFLVQNRRNVREILEDVVRYSAYLSNYASFALVPQASSIRLVKNLCVPREMLSEDHAVFCFSTIVATVRAVIRGRWAPLEVHLRQREAKEVGAFRKYFGCPVRFGCERDEIVLGAQMLTGVNPYADAELAQSLEERVQWQIKASSIEVSLTEEVTEWITRNLGRRDVSIQSASRELGVSLRSLQRTLDGEGVTFVEIKKRLVMYRAKHLLCDTSFSVDEIIGMLSYSDERAFSRAFKNYFGVTPGAFRRDLASNAGEIGTGCPGNPPRALA